MGLSHTETSSFPLGVCSLFILCSHHPNKKPQTIPTSRYCKALTLTKSNFPLWKCPSAAVDAVLQTGDSLHFTSFHLNSAFLCWRHSKSHFHTAVLEGCLEPIMAQWEPSLYSVQLKPFTLTKSILSFAFKPREFKPYPVPLLAVEQVLCLAYSQKPRSRGHVEVLNSQTLHKGWEPQEPDRPGQQRSCYWLGENILWWANIWHTGFQLYSATGEFK